MSKPEDTLSVTLSVQDIEKVVRNVRIKEIIAECEIKEPGNIGACAEDELLERLMDIFDPDEQEGSDFVPVKMADWIKSDPDPDGNETCRSCALPVTLQWYRDELKNMNRSDLATRLERISLSANPLTVAQELDTIKDVVGAKGRARLLDFDAATQVNN